MSGDPGRPKPSIRQTFLTPLNPVRNGPTPRRGASVQPVTDTRNGLPVSRPYVWHRDDARREAEIAAYQEEVTRLRAELLDEREAELLAELKAIRELRNTGQET